ncbi:hypothetical protein ACHAPU_003161 [Fusarium lateritium]
MDTATRLQKANRLLRESIGCKLNPTTASTGLLRLLKQVEKSPTSNFYHNEDDARGFWNPVNRRYFYFHPKHTQLVIRSTSLLQFLQELQLLRERLLRETTGQFRQDLGTLSHSMCYASMQLEKYARDPNFVTQSTLRLLQETSASTYQLCRESRNDSQRLDDLISLFGVELTVVETAVRRVKGLIADIQRRPVVSDTKVDAYEAELMLIGQATMEMLDTNLILPKPAPM